MGEENHAEWRAAMHDPDVVRAMVEDYRAGLGVDAEHERADRAAGRTVEMPLLVLWSLRDDLADLYGDVLAIWQPWAPDRTGFGIDSGHHIAEQAPAALVDAVVDFVAVRRPARGAQAAPGVSVRAYEPGDAVGTYAVFRAAVHRTALACYTPAQVRAWAPDGFDMQSWAERRAAAWTIVAVEGERVVAFADLTGAGEMDMLYVHPDRARAGIATALVARVVDQATGRGLGRVQVHASRVLQPLLARLGFTIDQDHVNNHRRGQVLVNATMHLDLQRPAAPIRQAGQQHP